MKRFPAIDEALAAAGVTVADEVYAVLVEVYQIAYKGGEGQGFEEGWSGALRAIREAQQSNEPRMVTIW